MTTTPTKRKGGRPAYEPTEKDRQQVATMCGLGIPDYDIAKVMRISGPTLRLHFWHELDVGHIQANAKVAQSLFRMATDLSKPNVAAAIFWLKTRARWTEAAEDAPGKKEQANEVARTADKGTAWDGLLQ
jgi:hypothetical protein